MDKPKELIWWLTQADCEVLKAKGDLTASVPYYIRVEFESRLGRAGRGRLWVNTQVNLKTTEISPHAVPDNSAGGIVIHAHHAVFVGELPGILTDLQGRKGIVVGGEFIRNSGLYGGLSANRPFRNSRVGKLGMELLETGARIMASESPLYKADLAAFQDKEPDKDMRNFKDCIQLQPIEWSDERHPGERHPVDAHPVGKNHVVGKCPLGYFLIVWDGYKDDPEGKFANDRMVEETPWGGWIGMGSTTKEAMAFAERAYQHHILQCLRKIDFDPLEEKERMTAPTFAHVDFWEQGEQFIVNFPSYHRDHFGIQGCVFRVEFVTPSLDPNDTVRKGGGAILHYRDRAGVRCSINWCYVQPLSYQRGDFPYRARAVEQASKDYWQRVWDAKGGVRVVSDRASTGFDFTLFATYPVEGVEVDENDEVCLTLTNDKGEKFTLPWELFERVEK